MGWCNPAIAMAQDVAAVAPLEAAVEVGLETASPTSTSEATSTPTLVIRPHSSPSHLTALETTHPSVSFALDPQHQKETATQRTAMAPPPSLKMRSISDASSAFMGAEAVAMLSALALLQRLQKAVENSATATVTVGRDELDQLRDGFADALMETPRPEPNAVCS